MILHSLLLLLAGALALSTLPLVLEVLLLSVASLLPTKQPQRRVQTGRLRLAVVVPAHNEGTGIARCIASLRASQQVPDDLYVIAHNCTDDTAAQAQAAGAHVLVLTDDGIRGKGAALLFGLDHAMAQGSDAALVIDADSMVDPHLTATVAAAFVAGAAAVQARYIASNAEATTRTRIMALSLTGMNVVRPRGRSRLGLSCGIFGNGFALSSATLRAMPYTAHSVVEDLEYHLSLVGAGMRVTFLDAANVYGELPDNNDAARTQRARWEGGRARIRRQFVPRLAGQVLRGKLRLLEPLFDLLSIPLGSVVPLLAVLLVLPVGWSRAYAVAGFLALALYVAAAVRLSPQPALAVRAMLAVPGYLVFKLGLLGAKRRAAGGQAAWVRTARNTAAATRNSTDIHDEGVPAAPMQEGQP